MHTLATQGISSVISYKRRYFDALQGLHLCSHPSLWVLFFAYSSRTLNSLQLLHCTSLSAPLAYHFRLLRYKGVCLLYALILFLSSCFIFKRNSRVRIYKRTSPTELLPSFLFERSIYKPDPVKKGADGLIAVKIEWDGKR